MSIAPRIARVLPNSEMMTAATLDQYGCRAMISKLANKSDALVNHTASSLVKNSVAPCPARAARMIPGAMSGKGPRTPAKAWVRA
jgi:hypothetical protein